MTNERRAPGEPSFVHDVSSSLAKRARAIKHRGVQLVSEMREPILPDEPHGSVELRLGYSINGSRVQLRVTVWDDRWVWIDVRRALKRGWAWSATCEGRYSDHAGSSGLIRRLEETITASQEEDNVSSRIQRIWADCLAKGLRVV